MSKPVYIAAYNQSKFGKLMDMTVPQILSNAVTGVCEQIKVSPSGIDVGSVGSACNFTLNKQGLLSGLVAAVPGMAASRSSRSRTPALPAGRPCCRSSTNSGRRGRCGSRRRIREDARQRRQNGRQADRRSPGILTRIPTSASGKVFIFPHLFAEIMQCYMQVYGVTEADLAQIAVERIRNAKYNP